MVAVFAASENFGLWGYFIFLLVGVSIFLVHLWLARPPVGASVSCSVILSRVLLKLGEFCFALPFSCFGYQC